MRPLQAERGGQLRCQFHPVSFQLLECLRHQMVIVESHQIGYQAIAYSVLGRDSHQTLTLMNVRQRTEVSAL